MYGLRYTPQTVTVLVCKTVSLLQKLTYRVHEKKVNESICEY